jgi:hypothetical protein
MEHIVQMDLILFNRLAVELVYFTLMVLFAAMALLIMARKTAGPRQVVAVDSRVNVDKALAEIAQDARARLMELPSPKQAGASRVAVAQERGATSAVLNEVAKEAQSRISDLPLAPMFRFSGAQVAPTETVAGAAGPVIVHGSKYLWESRWTHLPTFEQGREGEERVVNSLANSLGAGWYIFRNFVLPADNEDIDVVLVGPGGVYAIEVENYSMGMTFERSRCYVRTPQGKFYRQRRGSDVLGNGTSAHLASFLRERGLEARVAVKQLSIVPDGSAIARSNAFTVEGLRTEMQAIAGDNALSADEVRRVAGVLKAEASEQMMHASSRVH